MTDATQNADGGLAFFEDLHPPEGDFKADVLAGLSKPQKTLDAKYFYDAAGSEIFDAITEAPEYYLTRTELALLDEIAPKLRARAGVGAVVLEPGAGSSVKVRKLIDALEAPAAYVGMDISGEHVKSACAAIAADYPGLTVGAVCHDFTQEIDLSALPLPSGKRVVFFPGSTIGNFELSGAQALLEVLRDYLRPGDGLLIGVDLRKDGATLEAAYDDAGGVTAEFNYNLVRRINTELGGTIDPEALLYRVHWNPYRSRVEMYLQAKRDMDFTVADQDFVLREHETIHTENSHKFTISTFQDLALRAGLKAVDVWTDATEAFSIHWLEVLGEP
ncbi:L-histidine N(alpha)-methyltransferase [Maricaulaceae bacterium NA33B04]|nr:L-histidine N(alpha)-methyltransferase [Maricaulaceae bacterium NA33B04]